MSVREKGKGFQRQIKKKTKNKKTSEDDIAYEVKTHDYHVRIWIRSDPVLFLYGGWLRLTFTL